MRYVVALALFVVVVPATAHGEHETEEHESGWFEYVYDHDGDVVYCNALDYITVPGAAGFGGGYYIHDRPGPAQPYGAGSVGEGGGATWIYQEDNGIPGLQIGGMLPYAEWAPIQSQDPYGDSCPNGDSVVL